MIQLKPEAHDQEQSGAENVRDGLPGPDWTRDELCARAVWEYRHIEKGETYSPKYWFLGKFLREVRCQFGLDAKAWNAWRFHCRLANRTRCDRSMLLARAFDSPDEIERIPLLAALALAAERLGLEPRQTTADAKLRRRLASVVKALQKCLGEFSGVTSAAGLERRFAAAKQVLGLLDRERVALERRAGPLAPKRRRKKPK